MSSAALAQTMTALRPRAQDPEFTPEFYAPYEEALRAGLLSLCDARQAHAGDVLALRFRLKTPASIRGKLQKKGLPQSAAAAAACLHDIAALRAVLRDTRAVYRFAETLETLLPPDAVHDYIASPKRSGYRSLHLIVPVSVRVQGRALRVPAEIQLRTQEMDAWACMEHRLIYKPVASGAL